MKGIQSNGFLSIIAQAIAEMEELHGEFASIGLRSNARCIIPHCVERQ